jgi:hypothetical protein
MFENAVLGNTFESNTGEVTGDWRKFRNGELRCFYSSQNIIKATKSRRRRRRGTCHVEGEAINVYRVLVKRKEATWKN